MFLKLKKKRIYLDYASATPVRDEVLKVMLPYFSKEYGNAGAIHQEGVIAKQVVSSARASLASLLRIRPSGIVFTGSGTESNNLAILGVVEKKRKAGVLYSDMEIVSTAIEHASVLRVLEHVSTLGVVVRYVTTDVDGLIQVPSFTLAFTEKTILVVVGYVNSEIGVIQNVGKLARIAREKESEYATKIHIHVDAAQAPLWLPCALDALQADTLALDAGKCYGPKGVGILASQYSVTLEPYFFGGSQEGGLRPGTENVALIVGAVASLQIAQQGYKVRAEKITALRDVFITMLCTIDGIVLNGSSTERVANNVHISIEGIDSEFAVVTLNEKGIACATKSACGGARGDGSSVVRIVTGDATRALSTIRFTLGEATTLDELQRTTAVVKEHVLKTREAHQKLTK